MALADLIPERIKRMDLATAWRHAKSIAVALVLMWGTIVTWGGGFVHSYASDAMLKILKEKGIDAEAIEEMKQQGIKNGKDIGAVSEDVEEVQGALTTLSKDIAVQQKAVENTNELVKQLTDALLRRRTGLVEPGIPPFPGESLPE